jgi:hypothetical protein
MSNEENAKKAVDTAKEVAGKLFALMMDLKEKNAKVFYGGVGGVVLLLLILMMSGGSESPTVSGPSPKNLAAGQRYILKNPNTYEIESPIKLLPVPGSIAAYDDTEDEEKGNVESCRRISQGTPITIIGFQDFAGKKNAFANVQVEEGECKGNSGWISSINIQ